MASSRNRPPKPDPADSVLLSAVQRVLAEAAAVSADPAAADAAGMALGAAPAVGGAGAAPAPSAPPLVIAYSGGPDSTVLLDLACRLRARGVPAFANLLAVHVHHGLQPQADAWAQHCAQHCAARSVAFIERRVHVRTVRGVEAGARTARYAALAQVAAQHGARFLLTAHNADDRVETFLLQWLRGAGLDGLAGIAEQRELARTGVHLLRPLLEIPREQIEAYVERNGLAVVIDPSNRDPRFARNALRQQVLPSLARLRSGYRKSTARSMELIAEAAELLQEMAGEGLAACMQDAPPGMLRIDALATLAPARRMLVLRAWLAQAGIESPSRARLREALAQALHARGDARVLIRIGASELRRHRGLLCLRLPAAHAAAAPAREQLRWRGEGELAVPSWGGVLRFVPADGVGFDPDWLRERPLEVRARTGGERFKPHATRPSKRLKHLYQEAGVPEFERSALPLLWRDDRLIFVARVGADARLVERGANRVRIEWLGEAPLLGEERENP
jgi:tRNA(Ile)-lysidine synthase